MTEKIEKFLLKDITFILLVACAASAVFGATSIFFAHGTGLLNEIATGAMLNNGMATGDYTTAASYAAAFLVARVLEGPLVGILDIGGSLMTGVGVGVPALLITVGLGVLVYNFGLALLTGFAIGAVIGIVIMTVRKLSPDEAPTASVGIMMGAGNKTGLALGPLVFLYALAYSIPIGIGSIIGAALFYKYEKPVVGGAIIGVMVVAVLLMLIGVSPVVAVK